MSTITLKTVLGWPGRVAAVCLIAVIRLYQVTVSPLLGPACRFEPSCSRYMVESIKRYGIVSGVNRGLRRFLRWHPWNPGVTTRLESIDQRATPSLWREHESSSHNLRYRILRDFLIASNEAQSLM